MRVFRSLWSGLLALAVCGCAQTPVSTVLDDERPAGTATVRDADHVYCETVNDFRIGEPTQNLLHPSTPTLYEVRAGEAVLVVGYMRNDSFGRIRSEPKTVRFEAAAGCRYELACDVPMRVGFVRIKAGDWDVRVIDRDTDAVVFATHDKK